MIGRGISMRRGTSTSSIKTRGVVAYHHRSIKVVLKVRSSLLNKNLRNSVEVAQRQNLL
jgi:nicotinamide mononucleotide (NMN) deamidase PncC